MSRPRFLSALLGATLFGGAAPWGMAQVSPPSVEWTATAKQDPLDATGRRATLGLIGVVPDGWHVYALHQLPGGPTSLRVALEPRAGARLRGAASGTVPEKRHDPSFDLDTEYFVRTFTLQWPVEAERSFNELASLPVSLQFQLCSDRECQPPKTLHLLASIEVAK